MLLAHLLFIETFQVIPQEGQGGIAPADAGIGEVFPDHLGLFGMLPDQPVKIVRPVVEDLGQRFHVLCPAL